MDALKFSSSHNLVAFLDKPTESDGFKQIVDFLYAHPIKCALTVNPTIYTACIEQFWATAMVKTVNGEVQIQALVDKKKVIITETSVRSDLQLEDTECLLNATIFEQLTLMGYENLTQKLTFYNAFFSPQWKFLILTILQCLSAKTTAWNEFSSTMASVVILFLDKQVEGMSKHKEIYVKPSHTKKVFANVKRQGKDFLKPIITSTTTQPSTSKPQKKQSRRKQRKNTEDLKLSGPTEPVTDDTENVAGEPTHSNDPLLSGEDRLKLTDLMELYTKQSKRVLTLETTKTNQALEIDSLKRRVKKLEKKKGLRTHRLRRLYKVGRSARVISYEDEGLGAQEDASKQGRKIDEIDQDAEVTLVDETQGSCYSDFGEVVTTANVTLIEIKAAKPKAVTTAVTRPKARGVVVQEPSEFTTTTSPSTTTTTSKLKTRQEKMKQKLDENVEAKVDDDQEEAEMKKCMEIFPDDEVAIDAIPLATKPPIIIDWKIIKEGKIGYFQIIRADRGSKRPEEGYERVLWEKRYPLTPATITEMLNKKLQADHWNEMCYQLLKLMTKQLKNPGNV
ncbi:hypothetical protein Tco_1291768 [Tanacetum coccineum]